MNPINQASRIMHFLEWTKWSVTNVQKASEQKQRVNSSLLDSKIDMLLYTKTKTASIAEVSPQQLVLLHLQSTLQELHRLVTPDRDITSNLFVTPDPKGPHSVSCCRDVNNVKNHEQDRNLEPSTARNW